MVPFEKEALTSTQQLNEYIMTSLRTMEGLSLDFVAEKWNKEVADELCKDAQQWICQDKMLSAKNHLILTNDGKLFADGIAAEMFR